MRGKHIITIDQSTSASKVYLMNDRGCLVRRYAKRHQQFYPKPGHVEHDAAEIWRNVREGIAEISQGDAEIVGLAIANQRETTVLWDRATGEPVCPAIVWQDVRGEALCRRLGLYAAEVHRRSGLTVSPYFSAAKAAGVLEENPALRARAMQGELCIGTVDSYLVYRLTGGKVFQTDVSNASRTQLMQLDTLAWSPQLCDIFRIAMHCLPRIAMSDAGFGETRADGIPQGIPITGVMGDSHAALFGQGCHEKGMAKATYGTGSSVMMNVGDRPVLSQNGLSASVGYAIAGSVCYVLEGNVTCSGDTLCWLRDEAEMLADVSDAQALARTVQSTQGVYFVPAFSGLGAPYSDGNARALLCGMNRGTTRAHIVRAALESMAFQDADIIEAMRRDTGERLHELRVDGGPTANELLMQFQADILGCPVQCASAGELSALGAGYMAGVALGIFAGVRDIPRSTGARYTPQKDAAWRSAQMDGWRSAVNRCRS